MHADDALPIWQASDWPAWRYDLPALSHALARASHAQGLLLGRLSDAGMAQRDQASLMALTDDVVQTSAIEGDLLDVASVRSSVARRLGVDIARWRRSTAMWKAWSTWCSMPRAAATSR